MSVQLIQQYYAKVEQMIRYGGTRNESTLRKPFQDLLEQYARSKNLVLVPELDTVTTLRGVPAAAWEYRLGTYSALEWVLERYKEKKPKDPDNCGEVQYLQVRGLQGVRDRAAGEGVCGKCEDNGDCQGDGRVGHSWRDFFSFCFLGSDVKHGKIARGRRVCASRSWNTTSWTFRSGRMSGSLGRCSRN